MGSVSVHVASCTTTAKAFSATGLDNHRSPVQPTTEVIGGCWIRSRAGACSPMMAEMAAEVIIRPACAARHRRAPERPTKKSADEPTGHGTDRTSDHQTRACTDHIGVGGWRYVSLTDPYCALVIAFQRRRRANRICRLHLFKDEVVRLPTEGDDGDPGNFGAAALLGDSTATEQTNQGRRSHPLLRQLPILFTQPASVVIPTLVSHVRLY
jgi:hypothetical protein